jgi:hypothetical protein
MTQSKEMSGKIEAISRILAMNLPRKDSAYHVCQVYNGWSFIRPRLSRVERKTILRQPSITEHTIIQSEAHKKTVAKSC